MFSQSKLKKHADLMDRTATALGVDLEEAVLRGELDPQDIPEAVLRCAACTDPDHCASLTRADNTVLEDIPSYCRNKNTLAQLRDLARARQVGP
jgi:hypothetical protein